MKIIGPSVEYLYKDGLSASEIVERIGRTCYKSESKGDSVRFVKSLCESKHYAMTEHYWVHLFVTNSRLIFAFKRLFYNLYGSNSYPIDVERFMQVSRIDARYYISMPIRVLIEIDNCLYEKGYTSSEQLEYPLNIAYFMLEFFYHYFGFKLQCSSSFLDNEDAGILFLSEEGFRRKIKEEKIDPDVMDNILRKHITHTLKFVCDRGVSHELVRHRLCSFAQESTRYCNYSKDKFGKEITVIKPLFFNRFPSTADNVLYDESDYSDWLMSCEYSERMYFSLLEKGATPEQARSVLPNSLKTEIIVTANEEEWQNIVDLRYKGVTGSPHPQMKEVMSMAVPLLITNSEGRIMV